MDSSELRPADLWEHQSTLAHIGPGLAPAEASLHCCSVGWRRGGPSSRPSWGGSGQSLVCMWPRRRTSEISGIPWWTGQSSASAPGTVDLLLIPPFPLLPHPLHTQGGREGEASFPHTFPLVVSNTLWFSSYRGACVEKGVGLPKYRSAAGGPEDKSQRVLMLVAGSCGCCCSGV